jgi:hypothetical protein
VEAFKFEYVHIITDPEAQKHPDPEYCFLGFPLPHFSYLPYDRIFCCSPYCFHFVLGRAGVPGVPAVDPGWSAGPLGLLLMYRTVHVDTFPPVFIDNKSLRRSNKTVEIKVFSYIFFASEVLMEGFGSGIPTCFSGVSPLPLL